MEIQNSGTKIVVIVLSTLYQLSSASICVSQGYSFQSNTSHDQWLTSPSYPKNFRPPSHNCSWSLQWPTSLHAVKLKFNYFSLETRKTSCSDDYVQIRDGDLLSTSKLIGKFCGIRRPPIIVSKYKYIFVRFVSDFDSYPYTKKFSFSATFRAIVPVLSSGECQLNASFLNNNNLQLNDPSGGTFSTPSYPSHYPETMQCTWKITAPSDKRIKLYFNYFRLDGDRLCSYSDYLEVRDGSSSTSLKQGTYCGSYAPTVTSSGRYLWLRFRSLTLHPLLYKGFQARYEVISKSSSMVGTVVGVLIGIGVLVAIIVFVIYLVKRKNRRAAAAQALSSTTTTTTTVTTNQSIPAGYTQPIPQQYPSVAGPPPRLPPGTQPGPSTLGPHHPYPQGGPYNSAPGIPMNPAYPPPPYYQTEGMKAGPTNVELQSFTLGSNSPVFK